VSPEDSAYDEVLGPPHGRYDPEWVAQQARVADPGLAEETGRELAVYAYEHLREIRRLDAPEIARRLIADHPAAGVTAANVVAKAAVDLCAANEVPL
jgi:hypothetical protein